MGRGHPGRCGLYKEIEVAPWRYMASMGLFSISFDN